MGRLPETTRHAIVAARRQREWTQAELGQKVGLPQMHISRLEAGKIVPRFDTLLDLVRVLDYDLLLVPRSLVPAVQGLIRDQRQSGAGDDEGERALYAGSDERENGDEAGA